MSTVRLSCVALLLALGLAECSSDGAPVAERDYATKIVGQWQGTVGDVNEAITFGAGTIRGTWVIQGKSITLKIDSAENERVLNKQTMSTIEAFRPNELVLKSDGGGTATFVRVL